MAEARDSGTWSNNLECPICKQRYQSVDNSRRIIPKNLTCGHSFCDHCINDLSRSQRQSGRQNGNGVICPMCEQLTLLTGTAATLATNFSLLSVSDEVPPSDDPESPELAPAIQARARPSSPGFQVKVQDIGGRLVTVNGMHNGDTVLRLKQVVQEKLGKAVDTQILTFNGRELANNGNTLQGYGLSHGSTVLSQQRNDGGVINNSFFA